jgi:FAD binding domain
MLERPCEDPAEGRSPAAEQKPGTTETDDALATARNCRHFAMCKVDFLGSGVCASGLEKQYVSYFPVGRMDLYAALVENTVPVTERCVEIADGCNLCGKCDYQCYFVNELRPSKVMRALKERVDAHLASGGEVVRSEADGLLMSLRAIVGEEWATNDPAVRITYHHDLCPHVDFKMPGYVVMPNSKEEIRAVIQVLKEKNVPYVVRGNGASSHGLVFSEGAILDLNRMKTLEFDEANWCVKVGPGISSFELQTAAKRRGYRVNSSEPAALVCANVMTSGLISTFSATYGVSADNFVDAEFLGRDGASFGLNDLAAPNMFAFDKSSSEHEPFAICVSVRMKLHPITTDEEGVLLPFESLEEALAFIRDCARRHIGLAMGILGSEFVASFLAPTMRLTAEVKDVFTRQLGMPYLVLFIGDAYALRSVREMGRPAIDQRLFKALLHGLPALKSAKWLGLLREVSDEEPFSYLQIDQFAELAEAALAPSPAKLAEAVDAELRPFFEKLYARPEMSDLVWLNTFRIMSSRYCRERPCVALVCYLPIDNVLISELQEGLRKIASDQRLKSEFGFITPIDSGKRCVFEYDYYFDHNDPSELARIREATRQGGALLDAYSLKYGTIRQVRYVVNQGCCRKENLLYA